MTRRTSGWKCGNGWRAPGSRRPQIGGLVSPWADHAEAAVVDARAFQRALYDAGYAGLSWPERYGGRGLTPRHEYIFDQEAGRYELPSGVFSIGLGMCGPTLLAHGTEEQKARYIPPMLRGEEIWSQVFSEPGAGSDLAALRTRAVRDGDGWTLTGQKVWTSGALISQYGLVLARSDVKRPRHAGLTDVHRRSRRSRRDAPAAQADDGPRQVRRGLPRRRAGGGRPPGRRRERRLALRHHHAHERAVLRRRAQVRPAGRLGPAHHRQGPGAGSGRRPGRAPAAGRAVGQGDDLRLPPPPGGLGGDGRPGPGPGGVDPQAGHGGLHRAGRRDRRRPGRRGRRGLGPGPAGGRRVVRAALRGAVLHDRRRDHRGAEEPGGRTGSRACPGTASTTATCPFDEWIRRFDST